MQNNKKLSTWLPRAHLATERWLVEPIWRTPIIFLPTDHWSVVSSWKKICHFSSVHFVRFVRVLRVQRSVIRIWFDIYVSVGQTEALCHQTKRQAMTIRTAWAGILYDDNEEDLVSVTAACNRAVLIAYIATFESRCMSHRTRGYCLWMPFAKLLLANICLPSPAHYS